jgi:hypothetical protein
MTHNLDDLFNNLYALDKCKSIGLTNEEISCLLYMQDKRNIKNYDFSFVKKTNELIYIEVSENTYNNILNQNSQWSWQDYLPFNIPWSISGDKLTVAKTNKNIVDLIIQRLSLYKFNDYLRNDYTKFYK